jgi:hypothetical protein
VKNALWSLSIFCLLFFISAKRVQSQTTSLPTAPPAAAETGRPAAEPAEICLAPASVQVAAGKSEEAVQAVREVFVSFLSGPTLKVTPLTSRLASQAKEEARQGHCRYILFVTLTHKKKGGSNLFTRAAGDAAGTAVWHIPGGGSAGSAAARSAATSVASTALRGVSSNVKAKDEMTLDYRLETGEGSAPLLTKSEKLKAKSDGEDLLTPLVEHAASAIANTVTRK